MYAKLVRYIKQNVDQGLEGKQFIDVKHIRALVEDAIKAALSRALNELLLESAPKPEGVKPESEGKP